MKKLMLVTALALLAAPAVRAEDANLMTPVAQADSGLMVRMRAVYVAPTNGSDEIPGLAAEDAIETQGKLIPEVDFTYLFSKYLAAELILTYPQEQDVELDGEKLGSFTHLPPTLTIQGRYPIGRFTPYVGAGVNFTWITETDLGDLELEDYSFGFAAQGGVDVALYQNWFANVDVKWVTIRTDVKAGGEKLTEVRVDPWLIGAGVGYRF